MSVAGDYHKQTGKPPISKACPKCGRLIGGFFALGRFQWARHRGTDNRPCRIIREAGTGRILDGKPPASR